MIWPELKMLKSLFHSISLICSKGQPYIVVSVAEGVVEGETNEGEMKGRREPPKLVLPLVKMYVRLPQACRSGAR